MLSSVAFMKELLQPEEVNVIVIDYVILKILIPL